jgi:hypothetical protein
LELRLILILCGLGGRSAAKRNCGRLIRWYRVAQLRRLYWQNSLVDPPNQVMVHITGIDEAGALTKFARAVGWVGF